VELGVLGLVALLGFFAELVRYLAPAVRAGPQNHSWAAALALSWAAILVHGLVDRPLLEERPGGGVVAAGRPGDRRRGGGHPPPAAALAQASVPL
jgi:hypothetical protein